MGFPKVEIYEEGMREGMQIEDASITTAEKVRLLDALSATGLRHIVVGSFVSPKWTPQMSNVEEVIGQMKVNPDVEYTALVLNAKGAERREAFVPPLTVDRTPRTMVHACDVFVRRNTNRSQQDEIDAWPKAVEAAVAAGATHASVCVNAAFGSNWVGEISHDFVFDLLARQFELWDAAGIVVNRIWLGDPMGWNRPQQVERYLEDLLSRWPSVQTFHLHLHNQRGAAMVSGYQALRVLPQDKTLAIDTSIGGMGGCPYCGNGRATGMIPTEDWVDLLEEAGVSTGVDLDLLIDAASFAEEVVGRRLDGKVTRAGARPRGARLYPMDMPFVETFEEASHFRNGPAVYRHQRSPWKEAISSWQRDQADRANG